MSRKSYRFHGKAKPKRRSPVNLIPADVSTSAGTAVLRIYDPIDSWGDMWGVSAGEFAQALDALDEGTETIELHLNSPGGEVFEAVAIANLLREHRASVTAVVDGLAASAASFIAATADRTVMGQNTQLMIHDPWGLCVGNAADMRDIAGRLDHLGDNIAGMYAAKAGGDVAAWRDAMLAETWYSAEEAVAAGLADEIAGVDPNGDDQGGDPDEDGGELTAFDLSQFHFAGRDKAPAPSLEHKAPEPESQQPAASVSEWRKRRHRENARKVS